jgi:glycine/D-amino acid oxidase-like deaminating enzyme
VAVIGAGIVGSSIAYRLARRGASVTLIDRGQPAGECTGKSFAWIGPEDPPLGSGTLDEYRRLEHELPGLPIDWTGALVWRRDAAETERSARERATAGIDVRLVERDEILRLEPNLREPPELAALTQGGALDPVETTKILVSAAQESGARVRVDAEANLVTTGSKVSGVRIQKELISTDIVVVAAGVGTNKLIEPIGLRLPIESSPALLVRLKTPRALVNRIVASPPREVRQFSADIIVTPEEGIEGGLDAAAERALADVQRMLTGAETTQLDSFALGTRPMPSDGLPIVGFAPGIEGLYIAVMHAGVNRAPIVGRLASSEIVNGILARQLDGCRPARFLEKLPAPL